MALRLSADPDRLFPVDDIGSMQKYHQKRIKEPNGLRKFLPSSDHNYRDMDPNPEYDPDEEILPIELPELDPESLSRDLVSHLGRALGLTDAQKAKAEDVTMLWLERRFAESLKAGAVRNINRALLVSRTPRVDLHDKPKYQGKRDDGDPEEFFRAHYKHEIDNNLIHSGHIHNNDQKLYNALDYKRRSKREKDGSIPGWSVFGIQSSDDFHKELTSSVKSLFGDHISLNDIKLFSGRMSQSLQEEHAIGR